MWIITKDYFVHPQSYSCFGVLSIVPLLLTFPAPHDGKKHGYVTQSGSTLTSWSRRGPRSASGKEIAPRLELIFSTSDSKQSSRRIISAEESRLGLGTHGDVWLNVLAREPSHLTDGQVPSLSATKKSKSDYRKKPLEKCWAKVSQALECNIG